MKPVKFPQANIEIAKSQDQYNTLPAHYDHESKVVTACFKLTLDEVKNLVEEGHIFLQVMTFGKPLQPLSIHTSNPLDDQEEKT